MRQKIDINEVELRTKIRAKYLRAMENEEWDLLPGEVYVRSFLRTYGGYLGLDPRELLDDFRRRYESPTDHEPPPIVPPGRERRNRERQTKTRRGIPSWAIIGVVIAIVAVGLYLVGTRDKSPSDRSLTPRSTASQVTHHRARTVLSTATSTAPAAKVHRRKVTVALVATGQVYVCLVDGAGKALIPGRIYDTGETIPTETAGRLLLTLGNASVTLKANGKPVPVAASSGAIGLEFTPTGHSALTGSALPTCTS